MKKIALYSSVLLMGLLGCTSQKKLVKDAPFSVVGPSSQEFASGMEQGGTGFTLEIPLEEIPSDIEFLIVYFRGQLLQPEVTEEDGRAALLCNFRRESPKGEGKFVMHSDPMEEVGNQPPAKLKEETEPFPFELKADEAVLEYKEIGKSKSRFYKIGGIKEKAPLLYPSRPQN
jgi:hypothetical protein